MLRERIGDFEPGCAIGDEDVSLGFAARVGVERSEGDRDPIGERVRRPEEWGAARATELARDPLGRPIAPPGVRPAHHSKASAGDGRVRRERSAVNLATHPAVTMSDVPEPVGVDLEPHRPALAPPHQHRSHVTPRMDASPILRRILASALMIDRIPAHREPAGRRTRLPSRMYTRAVSRDSNRGPCVTPFEPSRGQGEGASSLTAPERPGRPGGGAAGRRETRNRDPRPAGRSR